MEVLRKNEVIITGRLVAADIKKDFDKNGKSYISVNATIQSEIKGKTNTFEVDFYAREMTKDNKVNKLYTTYSEIENFLNKKVNVSGELTENRFWSSNAGQLVSAQKINGKFIKGELETTADSATFTIGGFVIKELVEKVNKNNEVYRYDLSIGQANYNNTSMSVFVLHVDPADTEIVRGVKTYQAGMTVQVKGNLCFTSEQVTVVDENSGFGEEISRVYTNKQKNYFITGGSNPIKGEESGQYSMDLIQSLIAAYKQKDVELQSGASAQEAKKPAEKAAPVTSRQSSLI